MRFSISINDAWSGQSVADAKIYLRVGEMEQSAKSDADGKFFREDDREYIGQNLLCRVERQGYELWETSTQVDQNEILLDVELTPETIELAFNVLDLAGKPLKGAQVSVNAFGQQVANATADANGMVRVSLSGRFAGEPLDYRAECEDCVSSSGHFRAKFSGLPTISLKKCEVAPRFSWSWWYIVFGSLVILIILAISELMDNGNPKPLLWLLIIFFIVGNLWWWIRRSTMARKKAKTGK